MESNYLNTLNPSQRAAVEYCDGPQLVIAGAGSGKTRVLTTKIAYLLLHGYQADGILALTFTKKAAGEMKERIVQLVGPAARRIWMGTFHSIFARILRNEAERIGFQRDFTIYDQADAKSLVKSIIKDIKLDDKIYKPSTVQSIISGAKNNLITPGMYAANRELRRYDMESRRPQMAEIYTTYWNRCKQAGAMDFDDLLLYTNILFKQFPEVLDMYQNYFQYILVDEYQDTNRAQHLIVSQLAQKHHHLCVVGDDAQSIYSFRGANIRNILDMQTQIEGTRLFKLERNYRSTQNIVDAANSLIDKNTEQIRKTIYSENEKGDKIVLTGSYSDIEEAYHVAEQIETLHTVEGTPFKSCAILYRTNAQSRLIEEALRKRGIEYRIFGGLSFYQRKEIKDIVCYLRLITNPHDEEAFRRIVNYPTRGIGDVTVAKLSVEGASMFDVCCNPEAYGINVNKGVMGKLLAFAALITHFRDLMPDMTPYELTRTVVLEAGIKADLAQDLTVEGQARRENVEELLSAIQMFTLQAIEDGREDIRLTDFLAEVSLSGDVEPEAVDPDDPDKQKESDPVSMMTIHQAKGLEFENVFIMGVEENLLPYQLALQELGGLEEERRLLYVAITRAGKRCYMSYSRSRFRNGKSELTRPSRFIKEINRKFIQQVTSVNPEPNDYSNFSFGAAFRNRW